MPQGVKQQDGRQNRLRREVMKAREKIDLPSVVRS
jgi:hypothetical protein